MADRGGVDRVPVAVVVMSAYRAVFGHLELVLELGWLPFLVLLPAMLAPSLVIHALPASVAADSPWLAASLVFQAGAAALGLAAFAVRWHRLLLFGPPLAAPRGVFARAWARFVLYALLFYAMTIAASLLGTALAAAFLATATPSAVAFAAALVVTGIGLVVARLSLLFPAAAYGGPLSLGAAWRCMRGNSWRLVAALILAALPVMLLATMLFTAVIGSAALPTGDALAVPPLRILAPLAVLGLVLNFIFVALGATVLTEFYRRLVLRPQRENPR